MEHVVSSSQLRRLLAHKGNGSSRTRESRGVARTRKLVARVCRKLVARVRHLAAGRIALLEISGQIAANWSSSRPPSSSHVDASPRRAAVRHIKPPRRRTAPPHRASSPP